MSGQQEVSAFGKDGEGDNGKRLCSQEPFPIRELCLVRWNWHLSVA